MGSLIVSNLFSTSCHWAFFAAYIAVRFHLNLHDDTDSFSVLACLWLVYFRLNFLYGRQKWFVLV